MNAPDRYDFALNRAARVAVAHVGREREPVIQIDDLLRTPDSLLEFAVRDGRFVPAYGPEGGYPGVRADAPLEYVRSVVDALDPTIRSVFGLTEVRLGRAECSLSLVTLPPEQLVAGQRAPHIDTTYALQFAFLHYLCPSSFGGTAFYRHRRTGFETITPERLEAYEGARAHEDDPPGYIVADTAHFEQLGSVAAQTNRLVVYRSRLLHSGLIPPDAPLSPDPLRGRLTANIFVSYLPA